MNNFAVYLYEEIFSTSKDITLREIGDFPLENMYDYLRELDSRTGYSKIPLRREEFTEYKSVHNERYVDEIIRLSRSEEIEFSFRLSFECIDMWYLLPGYEYGLGGMYNAIDMMKRGDLDRAFVATLPSHHAYSDHSHGYCLANTMAASARYAQKMGFPNILIIDWDFHHGDGTQDIFKHDGSIHTLSTHSILDLYMAAVRATKRGTTHCSASITEATNIPITKKHDPEMIAEIELPGEFYPNTNSLRVFKEQLSNLPFRPDMVLVFDGMDAHIEDISRDAIGWDNDDFDELMKTVLDFAGRHGCPVIASPGGSYSGGLAYPILRSHCELMNGY